MVAAGHRRGMTMVELMVSIAVFGIVMSAVMSSFLTTQRMLKDAMGLCELSLAAREVREKLLFNASPMSDGVSYSGLLSAAVSCTSGAPISSSGNAVTMEAHTMGGTLADRSATPAQVEIELKTAADGTTRYLFNNKTPSANTRARWFWPTGTRILNPSMSDMLSFDTAGTVNSSVYSFSQNAVRLNIDLSITSDVKNPDGTPMVRRERIVVPIFGVVQPFMVASGSNIYY